MSVDEEMLRPPQSKINPENTPYPSKYINLVDGTKMVVEQRSRSEVVARLRALACQPRRSGSVQCGTP